MPSFVDAGINRLRRYTRYRRSLEFRKFLLSITRQEQILRVIDIGGTVPFWEVWMGLKPEDGLHITLVNDYEQDETDDQSSSVPYIEHWRIDATALERADFSRFHIVFSNSCIEHLETWEDQTKVAQRIIESGRPYFVQVPNKHAPVDPHYPRPYVPFFACYPKPLQARLLTLSALGSGGRHTLKSAYEVLRFYNPLGMSEMKTLFPDATLIVERPFGVPMSILAYRSIR